MDDNFDTLGSPRDAAQGFRVANPKPQRLPKWVTSVAAQHWPPTAVLGAQKKGPSFAPTRHQRTPGRESKGLSPSTKVYIGATPKTAMLSDEKSVLNFVPTRPQKTPGR